MMERAEVRKKSFESVDGVEVDAELVSEQVVNDDSVSKDHPQVDMYFDFSRKLNLKTRP